MKNKLVAIAACILICVFQFVIISSVVLKAFKIDEDHTTVKLRCRLYDPMDIMKGRYVHLDFDDDLERIPIDRMPSLADVPYEQLEKWKHRTLYCIMSEDDEGYHVVSDATFDKPTDETLYIKFRIEDTWTETIGLRIHFEKYYMQEQYAMEAESILRERSFDEINPTLYLSVGKTGSTVQQKLEIEGIPIEEYLNTHVFTDRAR
jgi:uncharacterized membrane-anchored protein